MTTTRQHAERARRIAMPAALVQRPLRLIRAATSTEEYDPVTGVTTVFADSPFYILCRRLANAGAGYALAAPARQIANRK